MTFTAKYLTSAELSEAVRVEHETMGNFTYLKDAFDLYRQSQGELIGIYNEDTLAGIGRYTVLPDGSGWLECLRVSPAYQRQGAGRMIYDEYVKLAEKYGSPSMAMYTGKKNIPSSSLAEIYGLRTTQVFRGYHIPAQKEENAVPFKKLTPDECEVLMQYKDTYNDYLSVSRTFYRYNMENLKGFAVNGMVYYHEESGSLIIAGARFQHYKTLHVALMEGNTDLCFSFLKNYAFLQGIKDLTFTLATPNPLEEVLLAQGASMDQAEIIVKEVKF